MNSRIRRKNEARAYNAYHSEELRMLAGLRDAQQCGDKLKARVWWNRLTKLRKENPYHSTYNMTMWLERLDNPPSQEKVAEDDATAMLLGEAEVENGNNRIYSKAALTAMAVMATQALATPTPSKGR